MSLSLSARIESLVIRLAQEFNDVRQTTGDLAQLNTSAKASLVDAINELQAGLFWSPVV